MVDHISYICTSTKYDMVLKDNDKLILITNDDGLYAAGLKTLTSVMQEFGKVVVISATESRSGLSFKGQTS
jgi:hypothetical protein